jgi:hypothetical protein
MPSDFMYCVPGPEGAMDDEGLQYPWQTPARWTYPTREEVEGMREEMMSRTGIMGPGMRKEPNEGTGGIPDVASEECLKRAAVPWTQNKGTKVYLKVSPPSFPLYLGHHLTVLVSRFLNSQILIIGRVQR